MTCNCARHKGRRYWALAFVAVNCQSSCHHRRDHRCHHHGGALPWHDLMCRWPMWVVAAGLVAVWLQRCSVELVAPDAGLYGCESLEILHGPRVTMKLWAGREFVLRMPAPSQSSMLSMLVPSRSSTFLRGQVR